MPSPPAPVTESFSVQAPRLGAEREAASGDERSSRSNPARNLSAVEAEREEGAGLGPPRRRPVCPGQRPALCKGTRGACGEPDKALGRAGGCAGGARREPYFVGGVAGGRGR
ncbi:hypothetical protein GW7_12754 [Heterocephalus glaber]|uniref:Uncharacterized protein n=1 Tax=Heterocephalus glaber TaxID=10181 RepID=G5CAC3_HETGA|nr:hypothetical protein GW7_12754 [Heterocephalus glaber]